MIYTVTLNPAIDYVVSLDAFHPGEVNRSASDYKEAGGKGINVSRVLDRFDVSTTALGFIGGFTGKYITDYLTDMNIEHDFVSLQQDTRINVKLKAAGEESEVNGVSPTIDEEAYQTFIAKLEQLKEGDIVVLAGSLPSSLPSDTYKEIVAMLKQKGVMTILDTSGTPLTEALKASPAFVKPNHHELAELFDTEVKNDADVVTLAKRLHEEQQIDHVLISMAKDGAIYVGTGGVMKLSAPQGTAVNSVGAGDSAVAGFIYGWQSLENAEAAAKYAVASGSATAFSKTLCTKEEVEALLPTVSIEHI
ncbi:1-phosphofructokinase [Gracilibacillus sp. S3-1-1]|uniref:1-phosphofructokinase n=1 Tax=Gracilibacillus pellucidus TaxID=3095368 RepID=A0ACC6M2P5_9BACI|nr:1-phosphofructokinase [Gracilibacillus sp. S3-1-1]MDX8045238.1 1-phosphofructokinase [Gracilibacillus sp. S3-1-1]